MTARRAQDGPKTQIETPDGVPIEELPGWDTERGVFVLDWSRSVAGKRRPQQSGLRQRERARPSSAQRRKK